MRHHPSIELLRPSMSDPAAIDWRAARALCVRVAAALLAFACAAVAAAPADASRWQAGSLADRLDRVERRGWRAAEAAAALAPLAQEADTDAEAQRALLFTRGRVAAMLFDDTGLAAVLEAMGRGAADPAQGIDAAAVQALQGHANLLSAQFDAAARHAHAALAAIGPLCGMRSHRPGALSDAPLATLPEGCDYRIAWQALHTLEREARGRRAPQQAAEHLRAAVDLALRAGDDWRRAVSTAYLAYALAQSGQADAARDTVAQALRIARPVEDGVLFAQLRLVEAQIARQVGEESDGRRLVEEGLVFARSAGQEPLEITLLTNLSDIDVKAGKPALALASIRAALPLVRERGQRRTEAVLTNNAGLALIALGRAAEAQADMERVIALWRAIGLRTEETITLREFGEAYAAAGDARTALALYHRERMLSRELDQAHRERALQELTTRYDSELRERRIELLRSENTLKSAALENQALRQRLWAIGAAAVTLCAALAALLYWRVREAHRELARSQVSLRRQSERDPLTGLANRRHFRALMQQREREAGVLRGFEGTLLLLDVDHFKSINDTWGHAAGDAVLTEVARRLTLALRDEDLLARWGGEEFLVGTRALAPAQVQGLAERLLQAVAEPPLTLPGSGTVLSLTASIGHASLPLAAPAGAAPWVMDWEHALRLVDAALYVAKRQGRNRAVGIATLGVAQGADLSAVEADLARAAADGRVALSVVAGPAAPRAAATPAQAA